MESNNIEQRLNEVFINLKILSNIKEYDKLISYSDEPLEIDKPTYFQGVRRWWTGQSRKDIVSSLKDFLYKDTFTLIDETLESEIAHKEKENYFRESNNDILHKFSTELTNTVSGLSNLKITYMDDITFKSEIDVIIGDILFRIEKIKDVLTINQPLALRNGKIREQP